MYMPNKNRWISPYKFQLFFVTKRLIVTYLQEILCRGLFLDVIELNILTIQRTNI